MSYIPNIPSAAYLIPCIRGLRWVKGVKKNEPCELIVKIVCSYYEITEEQLKGPSRVKLIAEARHVFCFFARNYTTMTLKHIGAFLGGRDHTTILNSHNFIIGQLTSKVRRDITGAIEDITNKINNYDRGKV